MSWASDNPELYDELSCKGILDKIEAELGYKFELEGRTAVLAALDAVNQASSGNRTAYEAFVNLCVWASTEVSNAQADYLAAGR